MNQKLFSSTLFIIDWYTWVRVLILIAVIVTRKDIRLETKKDNYLII